MFLVGTDPVGSTPIAVALAGVNYADSDPVGSFSDLFVGLLAFITGFLSCVTAKRKERREAS